MIDVAGVWPKVGQVGFNNRGVVRFRLIKNKIKEWDSREAK